MGKKLKFVFICSLVLNIFLIVGGSFAFFKLGGINYLSSKISTQAATYEDNPYYVERTDLFSELDTPKSSTIFIGDSITQRGIWEELFPNTSIANRGINSDTTEGVLHRLDDIIQSEPKQAFIMIGVNDIYAGFNSNDITSNYKKILNKFKNESPNTDVYVQSILPVNNSMYFAGDAIQNNKVQEVNEKLEELANDFDYQYVDLYSKVVKDNQLQKSLTYDGIHLSGEGYAVWKEEVASFIE